MAKGAGIGVLICLGLVALLSLATLVVVANQENVVSDLDKQEIASLAASLVNADLNVSVVYTSDPKVDEIADVVLKDDRIEAEAERIALNELSGKDFRKAIQEALNDAGENVESYKDIEEVYSVSVEDVTVSGETAEVEVEFKVKFFNDSDDESDDLVKARLVGVVKVSGLDYDDNFEDAEADEYDLSVDKIYD